MTAEKRLWTNYYEEKYPWSSYNTTCSQLDKDVKKLTIEYKEAAKKAVGGSKSDIAKAEALENVLRQQEGKYNISNCENELSKQLFESEIKPIYEDLTSEYLEEATVATQNRNKLTMGIGAAIMVVGLILIIKK